MHAELIPAQAGDERHPVPCETYQTLADIDEEVVSGRMAVNVVDALEPVQVQEGDGEGPACPPGRSPRLSSSRLQELPAVGQAGQAVGIGDPSGSRR